MLIYLPQSLKEGLNYAVLRADVKENKGLSLKIEMLYDSFTNEVSVSPQVKAFTVIYPVTIRDRIAIFIKPKKGTIVDNFSYAFISKNELPEGFTSKQTMENKIYSKIRTLRKKKQEDEFFDLSDDIKMEKDRLAVKKFKPAIMEYKKLIYNVFKYYYKKKNILLKGGKTKKRLTEEEKKMLKSLGYL